MTAALPIAERQKVLSHCPEIDSLRALAMIAVVAMHSKLFPIGWAGVWLFFVISGYVVTLSIARNRDPANPVKGAVHFAQQRVARILPPYFFYILAGLAITLALSIQQPIEAVASLFGFYHNVTMLQGVGDFTKWPVGHLWTISVEMQFYLIYGLLAYFAPLAMTRAVLWSFIILAPLARFAVGAAMAGNDPEATAYLVYSAPGLHFDSFAMGCLFAMARLTIPLERMLWPIVRLGCAALALYVATYVCLNIFVRDREGLEIVRDVISGILYGEGREVFLYTALGLGSLALLALTLARHPLVQFVTGRPLLQWIGRLSYGGYIYHALCLNIAVVLIGGRWSGMAALSVPERGVVFCIGLVLTIAMAQLSWWLIEKPAAAAVRRFGKSGRPVAAGASG